jgi:hypothetical protein
MKSNRCSPNVEQGAAGFCAVPLERRVRQFARDMKFGFMVPRRLTNRHERIDCFVGQC